MSSLYRLAPAPWALLPVALALTVILQTCCIAYGFFRLRYHGRHLLETFLETAILMQLLLLTVLAAEAVCQSDSGFVVISRYEAFRFVLYAVIAVLSIASVLHRKSPLPLLTLPAAFLTLPVTERLMGRSFPIALFGAILLWILRSVFCLRIYAREQRESLSAFSVREAVDTMDFGLLFCRTKGMSDGQILLINRKMQELMFALTGKRMYNGREFYRMLTESRVTSGCQRCEAQPQLLYRLPDGMVWEFKLQYVPVKKTKYALLTASDATENWKATWRLYRQNRELEKRNRELKEMLRNMETICRCEETIHIKGLVHDLLGQKITFLLRSVREHQELNESMLSSFAHGLPEELKEMPADFEYSLKVLVNDFSGLGISIHTEGEFPQKKGLQKLFFEITAEAVSNAVRHGYATEINIQILNREGLWELNISDNGIPDNEPVVEGGGLRGIRRKAAEAGGEFHYEIRPHFSICVTIPQGGVL